MSLDPIGSEWEVEWATPTPDKEDYLENLVLSREQAVEYGDELVGSLQVDETILRERGLDPKEPFVWKIVDGELVTEQISRQSFEEIAESDHDDALYARQVLEHRAKRRIHGTQS